MITDINFRNTRPILEASNRILDSCESVKAKEEYISPQVTDKHGPKPQLVQYQDEQQQVNFIIEEILRLSEQQLYRPGDIVILSRYKKAFDPFTRALGKAKVPFSYYRRPGFSILENEVKLITMHSAKGLEFPVVFLVNLAEGTIPPSLEDPEMLEQERRLLYVSMTRTCDRLYLLHTARCKSSFLYDLTENEVKSVTLGK